MFSPHVSKETLDIHLNTLHVMKHDDDSINHWGVFFSKDEKADYSLWKYGYSYKQGNPARQPSVFKKVLFKWNIIIEKGI